MDPAQEIRNHHITKEEGAALLSRYEGEYPSRYEEEFLKYIDMTPCPPPSMESRRWAMGSAPQATKQLWIILWSSIGKMIIGRLDIKGPDL